jgi:predicted DNA-binding protein
MEDNYKTITIRIEKQILNRLNEICKRTGLKKQEVAGRAITDYLNTLEQSDVIKFLSKE